MERLVFSESAPKFRSPSLADYDFELSAVERRTVISGEVSTTVTIEDSMFDYYAPAIVLSEEDVQVTDLTENNGPKEMSSLNGEILTVDQDGRVSRVSDGTAPVLVRGRLLSRRIDVSVSLSESTSFSEFAGFAEGTLAEEMTSQVDSRIAGLSASSAISVFSVQDHASGTYARNPDCWAAGLDLTPFSPWNSDGGKNKAGTLVSPRHILFAYHYRIAIGSTVRFVAADGTVHDRTLSARQRVGSSDIMVGLLDSDLPGSISFCTVLPDGYDAKLPNADRRIPAMSLDYEEKATVRDFKVAYTGDSFYFFVPESEDRLEFYEEVIGGDSGNPAVAFVGGSPVLLTLWHYGWAGSGDNIYYWKDSIDSAMSSLGGGYSLTEADFSSFPDF